MMRNLSLTFILLEHFSKLQNDTLFIELTNAVRCYKWNTARNSILIASLFFSCLFLPISCKKMLPQSLPFRHGTTHIS